MRYTTKVIFKLSILLCIFIFVKIIFTFTLEIWQIILFAITLPVSLLTYLMLNPPMIRGYDSTGGRRELPPDSLNDSDFLLVVSKEMGAGGAKEFSVNNCGLFWINILEKETGSFSMIDAARFNSEAIKNKKAIVFPKGTTEKLTRKGSHEFVSALKEFCENGGIILLETPAPSISELTGVALSDKGEIAGKIDWIEPDLLSAGSLMPSSFSSMPLNTIIHSSKHKGDDVKAILKMDGKDAILERRIKKGKAVILCFDLSLQIFSIKQGIPPANDSRAKACPELVSWIGFNSEIRGAQTSDMAINSDMKRNHIPYADIFERFIMDITLRESNIPVWWHYPHNYSGASIITFDEDFYGDRLLEIDNVRNNKIFSHFIISDSSISLDTVERLNNRGDEAGIHWNRFYFHINRFGLHYCKNKSLKGQINRLSAISRKPNANRLSCRIHYLRWGNDYTEAFEIMDNSDIYMDSSYGPGRDEWGYVFGTGFPFLPLNKEGAPFKLYEFPFHCHEPYGNMDEGRFDRLMDESVNNFNTAVVYLFHPYHCKKGGLSYGRLMKAMDDMNGKRWVANFREYMSFYEARKKSSIKSTRIYNKICIEADVKQDGMCISLRHFQKIKDIAIDNASQTFGSEVFKTDMLSLSKCRHIIEIMVQ